MSETDSSTAADAIFDQADEAALKIQAVKRLQTIDYNTFGLCLAGFTLCFIMAGIGADIRRIAKRV